MTRGMDSLKHELAQEKEKHALTCSKYLLLLSKAKKWEGKVIDKLKKLTKATFKLNAYMSHVVELEEAKEKVMVEIEARYRKVAELKEANENAKCELSAMAK